jgi:hypothetical protein
MLKRILIILFFFFGIQSLEAQIKVSWRQLERISFSDKYLPEFKYYIEFPVFTDDLKSLNGKEILISGYIIPFDNEGKIISLSANSYESCFFCGKAGPASIMTVKLQKANKNYYIDQWGTFKGKLKLNSTDYKEFCYILEDAVEVK